ncbi:exocyst complex component EXO70A1-like protein [Tanacetum coccineum]
MDSPETDRIMPLEQAEAEQIILRWDSSKPDMIFDSCNRHDIDNYLSAVDLIQLSSNGKITEDNGQSTKVNTLIQIAMARLEDEFRNILISHTTPLELDSVNLLTKSDEDSVNSNGSRIGSNICELDVIPEDQINDLRLIAKRMMMSGHVRECVQVYGGVRKITIDACFKKLGVEKLSLGDVQRLDWESLNAKISKYIKAVKICVRILFASEKRLCLRIFENLGHDDDDDVFLETVKSAVITLFNFAEAISISKRSPEKLFKIVDLHDALLDLLPDIEDVFGSKSSESIRVQASEILSRLAEAARGMLYEFESSVLREPSRVLVPGGTIHPLTRYVMNYISLISDYKQTLGELIVSKPVIGSRHLDNLTTPDMDLGDHEGQSPLALHLIWIIVILQFNLDGKSKHYKDDALAYLFFMNNVHYIVQKVKGSPELREMIGDSFLKQLTAKITQASTRYQRATWVGVLYCLRDEGLHATGSLSSGVPRNVLRERFKSFNAMFEEVHKMQTLWSIPDTQLREEIQISISEKVIPAYRSFLGRFRTHIENGRHPEYYIKYSVEDLETAVLDFFEGCAVSQLSRRKSL